MELGAVSVMLYCFRERELILNINELIAGFRMFPSYIRIGGLREDLPSAFHDLVRELLDRMPAKLDELRETADQQPDLPQADARLGVRSPKRTRSDGASWADFAPRVRVHLRRAEGISLRGVRHVRVRHPGRLAR